MKKPNSKSKPPENPTLNLLAASVELEAAPAEGEGLGIGVAIYFVAGGTFPRWPTKVRSVVLAVPSWSLKMGGCASTTPIHRGQRLVVLEGGRYFVARLRR